MAHRTDPTATRLLSEDMAEALARTRPWMRMLAVFGFVLAGFFFLGAIVVGSAALNAAQTPGLEPAPSPMLAVIYLVLGALALFPSVQLFRYARTMRRVQKEGVPALESTLKMQHAFWRSAGIAMLVFLGIWVLLTLGAAGTFAALAPMLLG